MKILLIVAGPNLESREFIDFKRTDVLIDTAIQYTNSSLNKIRIIDVGNNYYVQTTDPGDFKGLNKKSINLRRFVENCKIFREKSYDFVIRIRSDTYIKYKNNNKQKIKFLEEVQFLCNKLNKNNTKIILPTKGSRRPILNYGRTHLSDLWVATSFENYKLIYNNLLPNNFLNFEKLDYANEEILGEILKNFFSKENNLKIKDFIKFYDNKILLPNRFIPKNLYSLLVDLSYDMSSDFINNPKVFFKFILCETLWILQILKRILKKKIMIKFKSY